MWADIQVIDEVGSTMDVARDMAPDLTRPTWVLAKRQTGGRGRRARAWAMPEGNFAASLVYRPVGPVEQIALRSFAAACALRAALIEVGAPPAALSLKWPNDVLFHGGKLAGILLESLGDGRGGVSHLVIGIGVNLAKAPDAGELEPGAVPPVALGIGVTPEDFLHTLAPAFAEREERLATYGFDPLRTEWLANAARLGDTITARLPNEEMTGVFKDIDGAGNLILSTSDGERAIAAAEIYF